MSSTWTSTAVLAAVRSLPGPLGEPPHHDDPGALAGGLGQVLGQLPPGNTAEEAVGLVLEAALAVQARRLTATVNLATAVPFGVKLSSGSAVRLPANAVAFMSVSFPTWQGSSLLCALGSTGGRAGVLQARRGKGKS